VRAAAWAWSSYTKTNTEVTLCFASNYQLTLGQSPSSETNSRSASQEIPCLLWNPTVQYSVHNIPPLVPILSHMYPIHKFPTYFPKIHPNISSHLHLGLPNSLFHSGFPTNNLYTFLIPPMRAICSAHPILLDLITLITFGDVYKLRNE